MVLSMPPSTSWYLARWAFGLRIVPITMSFPFLLEMYVVESSSKLFYHLPIVLFNSATVRSTSFRHTLNHRFSGKTFNVVHIFHIIFLCFFETRLISISLYYFDKPLSTLLKLSTLRTNINSIIDFDQRCQIAFDFAILQISPVYFKYQSQLKIQ